jgi:hypothetical protein
VTTREGEEDALTDLVAPRRPRPYAPPWVRLFLEASERLEPWIVQPRPCWRCAADDLVFVTDVQPPMDALLRNRFVVLCLRCGALELWTEPFYEHDWLAAREFDVPIWNDRYPRWEFECRLGGTDWSAPDAVVDDARRAIRAGGRGEEQWEDEDKDEDEDEDVLF